MQIEIPTDIKKASRELLEKKVLEQEAMLKQLQLQIDSHRQNQI
jgi:hypothetical protein